MRLKAFLSMFLCKYLNIFDLSISHQRYNFTVSLVSSSRVWLSLGLYLPLICSGLPLELLQESTTLL